MSGAAASEAKVTVPQVSKDGPALAVVLLTYDRLEYAKATLAKILFHLKYTRGPVCFHVASDGDDVSYVKELVDYINDVPSPARKANGGILSVTTSNSARGGYGANYNLATQVVHQLKGVQYVIPLEDDWECLRELNADALTNALDASDGSAGCIRLGYLGFTQELWGTVRYLDGAHYLAISPDSPEPHVFAGHPRIETVAWERSVGPWQEGIGAGATEFEVTHRAEARQGVLWPLFVDPRDGYGLFAHSGTVKAADIV